MLSIPFVKNPGGQCGQACMVMVLEYYFPGKEFSIGQMETLMLRKPGKWTFPHQSAVVLDDLGLNVKTFSSVDISVGKEAAIRSFKDAFGADYDDVIKKIDLDTHQYFVKIAKERKIFEVRKHTLKDIKKYVDEGFVPMVCVDLNVLRAKKGVFTGHFVVVTGMDNENVWINEPNQGPNIRYSRELFDRAYNVSAIDDDILVVFGKK